MGRKAKIYPIPQLNLKYVELPFDNNFIFYQDGSIFSRRSGKFLMRQYNQRSNGCYTLFNKNTGKITSFSVKSNLKKYFNNQLPQIDGVEHKPIIDFEDLYQFYSNGKIFSKITFKFLKSIKKGKSQYVSLKKAKRDPITFYIDIQFNNYFNKGV